jgi:hypothetical protein
MPLEWYGLYKWERTLAILSCRLKQPFCDTEKLDVLLVRRDGHTVWRLLSIAQLDVATKLSKGSAP